MAECCIPRPIIDDDREGSVSSFSNMNLNSSNRKPVRLRTRLREVAHDTILMAAEESLARHGIDGASMQIIAVRAGVGVGTLYNHFEDRDALLRAIFQARRDELCARLDQAITETAGCEFRTQLSTLVRAALSFFDEHRDFLRLALDTEHDRRRPLAPGGRSAIHHVKERLLPIFARGIEHGALRPEAARLYPAVLLGILRAVLESGAASRDPIADACESTIELFLHGAAGDR